MKLNLLCSFFLYLEELPLKKGFYINSASPIYKHFYASCCTVHFVFFLFMSVSTLMSVLQLSGQFSQRLFRKLPPRVCVPLKNIVSEEFLRAGSVFVCVLIGLLSLCTFPYKVDCSTTCLTHWEPLPVLILIWCIGLVHPYLPVTFMFRMRIYHV